MPKKITFEEAKESFKERGCVLLETDYINSTTKMKYKCVCGNIAYKNLSKIKQGQLCYECGRRRGGNRKYNINIVKDIFKSEGCRLNEDAYINPKTKMKYTCECGRNAEINLDNFLNGRRCQGCRVDKLYGKKDKEYRDKMYRKRKSPEYLLWRQEVLKRDVSSCKCCGEENTQMNVHHIESFSRRPNIALEIDNGVTLCNECHKEYHSNFFHADATAESFHEFMFGEYRDPWYAGEVKE